MSWTLDGKCRIHARLSNTSYMRVHYRTRGSLRRLYIGKFLSLHFEDRDEGFVSKGSKDILHDNKIFSCTMELPNGSASPVMILFCFVLFCFHLGRICDLCFSQKCWKSFYSCDKNILFSYDIIRGTQQATSISFFLLWGFKVGIEREHFSWVANQSTGFPLARGSHL